jgi:hypothetical protein
MTGTVLRLKVTIDGTKPEVWRRVVVPDDITLSTLHEVFQAAFGWLNAHLHEYEIGGVRYGIDDGEADETVEDETATTLKDVASVGETFTYTYDFGDDWIHTVEVEKELSAGPGTQYPRCVEGRRAGPPEDCGGPSGYQDVLVILDEPSHQEHASTRELVGVGFDPEIFDLNAVNNRMPRAKRERTRNTRRS